MKLSHSSRKRFSHEYRTKFYITRCENADFCTRSVRKIAFYTRSDIKFIILLPILCSNHEPTNVAHHNVPSQTLTIEIKSHYICPSLLEIEDAIMLIFLVAYYKLINPGKKA